MDNKFEYGAEGRLIIDELYYVLAWNCYVVEINCKYYKIPRTSPNEILAAEELANRLIPIANGESHAKNGECLTNDLQNYIWYNIIPRDLNWYKEFRDRYRPITPEEFEALKAEYHLDEESISKEFETTRRSYFGAEFARTETFVQIKVVGNPIIVESELNDMGIDASAISSDRVNIRVE